MTANFKTTAQRFPGIRKSWKENSSLYSLIFLVMLLLAVFTFWKPQGDALYTRQLNSSEAAGDFSRDQSELQYRNIVTNGDAIRSIIQ